MQIWSLINQPELASSIGVSSFLLTTVITFMGVIILIAGIGMFKGERWAGSLVYTIKLSTLAETHWQGYIYL